MSPPIESTPAERVRARIENGESLIVLGACTPFHARLLREIAHDDIWLGSFELSTLLGVPDNESLRFPDIRYFTERILACVPEANVFLDCDTGWDADLSALAKSFGWLSGRVAMVVVQNLRVGSKVNSFLLQGAHRIVPPPEMAERLRTIGDACPRSLVALRL